MKDTMNAFFESIEKIYSAFILRDFAAKIIPGFIACFPIILILFHNEPDIFEIYTLKDIPFIVWLGIMFIFWIAGFAMQSIGESLGLINYYYPNTDDLEDNLNILYDKLIERKTHKENMMYRERLTVIMKTCGIGAVSILFSLPLYFAYVMICFKFDCICCNPICWLYSFLFIVYIGIGIALIKMHEKSALRSSYYTDKIDSSYI